MFNSARDGHMHFYTTNVEVRKWFLHYQQSVALSCPRGQHMPVNRILVSCCGQGLIHLLLP